MTTPLRSGERISKTSREERLERPSLGSSSRAPSQARRDPSGDQTQRASANTPSAVASTPLLPLTSTQRARCWRPRGPPAVSLVVCTMNWDPSGDHRPRRSPGSSASGGSTKATSRLLMLGGSPGNRSMIRSRRGWYEPTAARWSRATTTGSCKARAARAVRTKLRSPKRRRSQWSRTRRATSRRGTSRFLRQRRASAWVPSSSGRPGAPRLDTRPPRRASARRPRVGSGYASRIPLLCRGSRKPALTDNLRRAASDQGPQRPPATRAAARGFPR